HRPHVLVQGVDGEADPADREHDLPEGNAPLLAEEEVPECAEVRHDVHDEQAQDAHRRQVEEDVDRRRTSDREADDRAERERQLCGERGCGGAGRGRDAGKIAGEDAVAAEGEQHTRADGSTTKPRTESTEDRHEVEHIRYRGTDIRVRESAERRAGGAERVHPGGGGARRVASWTKMTATSARISTTATSSTARRERVVVRAPREARIPISAQPASASGHHGGDEAIPVLRRNACPKIATPMIETGGKT